ncbi:MAG: type II secretion system protein [Armatimonadota bacterium]
MRFRHRRQSGQTLVIAVMVMFLLSTLGAIFIAVLGRNMTRTQRHSDTLSAQYLAEAGIRYADSQLTYSPDGADWRPVPDNIVYDESDLLRPNFKPDPDFRWLRPFAPTEQGKEIPGTGGLRERGPSGGFTRVPYGNGRFLIRVSYNPSNWIGAPLSSDVPNTPPTHGDEYGPTPLSKYIRIESIGREGVVDPKDPTTFTWTNLRHELVAFKPIAITDYLLFVTNRDQSNATASIGVDPFPLADKLPDGSLRKYTSDDVNVRGPGHLHNLASFYGPIRVNGNLMWRGRPTVYLNTDVAPGQPVTATWRADAVEVAGEILLANKDAAVRVFTKPGRLAENLPPSSSPSFNTLAGAYRDGLSGSDAFGQPRGVRRLEAPDIDAHATGSRVTRYRLLTRDSTTNIEGLSAEDAKRAAQAGLGAGIYIDNRRQRQVDSGSFSLVDDWLHPGNTVTSNWQGSLYVPPGVHIVLLPGPVLIPKGALLDGRVAKEQFILPGGAIRITRTDPGGTWLTVDGKRTGQTTQYFQYPLLPGESVREVPGWAPTFQNGVIYAEGNIRIRGKLPRDQLINGRPVGQSLTIVSGGTIYIEGCVLKGDRAGPNVPRASGIALLARDYVCVNASGFFVSPLETYTADWNKVGDVAYASLYQPPFERYLGLVQSAEDFSRYPTDEVSEHLMPGSRVVFGARSEVPPARAPGVKLELFTQHTAEDYAQTAVPRSQGQGAYFGTAAWLLQNGVVHPWWNPHPVVTTLNLWTYEATPLLFQGGPPWRTDTSAENWLEVRFHSGAPYLLARFAVAPLDIRIEAALYAQTGSFFVIPGVWFNTNLQDTRDNLERTKRRALSTGLPPKSSYPLALEPLDIKLTILGAVAQNRMASEKAQEEWAKHWGWTPLTKPSGAPTAHGGDGLALQYDPELRKTLRLDKFGRPLPIMPKLPVSPDLVYFGEAM